MNSIARPTAAILLVLTVLASTTAAQQKRQTTPKTPPKPAAAPAPTFDTFLPADSYSVYVEVRSAGQLIRSNTVNDLLEPVLKVAGPPKEFKSLVKWLNAHAEQIMNSRLFVATGPTKPVPDTIVAIEFASPEEAAKFAIPLNEFLPTVLPAPEPSSKPKDESDKSASSPPAPAFHLQRLGSLVLVSQKPWTMKQLKPAGSKLLADDVNFRTARNRFNSEPVFVFIDMKALERQDEEVSKRAEAQREEQEQAKREQAKAEKEEKKEEKKSDEEPAEPEFVPKENETAIARLEVTPKEAPTPDPFFDALSTVGSSLFNGQSDWPDAIALALSFEGESFDLRALLVNPPGARSNVVPFIPKLIPGPALAPESPNIFPANTELLITMSVDWPQIYSALSTPDPKPEIVTNRPIDGISKVEFAPPLLELEKRLKMNLKDDLLPLLGSEIAVRLPLTGIGMLGMSPVIISTAEVKEGDSGNSAPAVAIAVKDKEALRKLMPKVIEALGFKGASSFAQTERKEDTELVSYANVFSYAFVGNFIVLSSDPAAVRQMVDSYLKHETLASDLQFKNYTRWQPRQLHGQIYISPALMESFKSWAEKPGTLFSDQTRAFLARLSLVPQPITYALSNEGFGPLHEVHIPKNLVLLAAAGISGEVNPSPVVQNERMALVVAFMIANAEQQYKSAKGNSNYATLEQLIAADMVSKELIEKSHYKFEVTVIGDKFEVTAVPLEYGKSGTMSYFIDQTNVLRGGDHSGAPATASDPPIN